MTRILVVASAPMEFPGILANATQNRPAGLAVHWSRLARIGGDEWLLVANGAGPGRAAAAVDAALGTFPAEAVVSAGFCGALAPELALAEIVVATAVAGENGRFPAASLSASLPHHSGVVCTIDHIARSAAEKRKLRAGGACAVDMEAAAVAGRAAVLGLPFYCIKTVTDLASEDLAIDLNAALRSDGHFDTMSILSTLLRRPLVRLPELVRLRTRSVRAARALGEFFADCRF